MAGEATKRDYSLLGASGRTAVETGLAAAEWYHTDVARKEMKALMQRSDNQAIRDTALWLGSMAIFATLGIYFWGSWIAVPFFLAYGVLYGSATDSRWHECGHGTAFKTGWMNRAVYQVACFMIMRNPTVWRWSHARHHADTIIVGRDPEIAIMRPPDLLKLILGFVGILDAWYGLTDMARYAFGHVNAAEKSFIPAKEIPRVFFVARVWVAIYVATMTPKRPRRSSGRQTVLRQRWRSPSGGMNWEMSSERRMSSWVRRWSRLNSIAFMEMSRWQSKISLGRFMGWEDEDGR